MPTEYGVNILDLLRSLSSRVVLTEPLPEHGNVNTNGSSDDNPILSRMAENYLVRNENNAIDDTQFLHIQVNKTRANVLKI